MSGKEILENAHRGNEGNYENEHQRMHRIRFINGRQPDLKSLQVNRVPQESRLAFFKT